MQLLLLGQISARQDSPCPPLLRHSSAIQFKGNSQKSPFHHKSHTTNISQKIIQKITILAPKPSKPPRLGTSPWTPNARIHYCAAEFSKGFFYSPCRPEFCTVTWLVSGSFFKNGNNTLPSCSRAFGFITWSDIWEQKTAFKKQQVQSKGNLNPFYLFSESTLSKMKPLSSELQHEVAVLKSWK